MYKKIIFQTAEEFFRACQSVRAEGDTFPRIPESVEVVFDGDEIRLTGQHSEGYGISPSVTKEDLITEAFKRAGAKFYYKS